MTFTIIGICEETQKIGMSMATVSLAVGGRAPFSTYEGDIVQVQAYGQPKVGFEATRMLNNGATFDEMKQKLEKIDPFFSFRQLGILKRSGEAFVHTGKDARPWAGHIVGNRHLVMGNFLVGPQVLSAMSETFEKNKKMNLARRLLSSIEAGRDAGGQAGPNGDHFTERSSLLRILNFACCPELDLRVDIHATAVAELRRLFEIYEPCVPFNRLRADDPANAQPTGEWEAQNLKDNPPPPAIG